VNLEIKNQKRNGMFWFREKRNKKSSNKMGDTNDEIKPVSANGSADRIFATRYRSSLNNRSPDIFRLSGVESPRSESFLATFVTFAGPTVDLDLGTAVGVSQTFVCGSGIAGCRFVRSV
jgi:hypothetical protein